MSKTAWITAIELDTYLTGLGVTRPDGVALSEVIDAVVSEWERRTGWSPFLSETKANTSTITLAGTDGNGWLRLPTGYTAIDSITVDGVAMVEGTDYVLWPEDKAPITRAQFRCCLQTIPPSIVVMGTRGWSATIPDDVWNAVRAKCAFLVNGMATEINGNVIGLKQGSVQINYSATGMGRLNSFDQVVARYRRVD